MEKPPRESTPFPASSDGEPRYCGEALLDRLRLAGSGDSEGRNERGGRGGRPGVRNAEERLRRSIEAELIRLLNTRAHFTPDQLERRPRTTLEYGICDLSHFSPDTRPNRKKLEAFLEETIAAYEPRLRGVRIEVIRLTRSDAGQSLLLALRGELTDPAYREPFTLETKVRNG